MKQLPHCEQILRAAAARASEAVARVGLGVLLFALAGGRAHAAVHPVPLDPKADPKTCLQCHEEKAKGKFVHTAIQVAARAATRSG